ncbi:YunG family protein [Terracoccus luteus]|uniref:Uncharacterized protein n=1 Tax=Terracoccus luteus TaxID=53356 RepID=A0A839PX79_9MICO|nr:hypothetical protein [Terracoccus luteus]MBB2988137.1 hypothetical protein [Terracoccus luteus]MCP2173772.1 hypothetical protein [Terracoccus luteus]
MLRERQLSRSPAAHLNQPEGGPICPTSKLSALTRALCESWNADTSAYPRWSPHTPSRGQCAVTALVVQDALGGDLERVTVDGQSHYYNRLLDGTELDLTRDQFAVWAPTTPETRTREYVLSYAPTTSRYELLKARVAEHTRTHPSGPHTVPFLEPMMP